MRHLTLVEVIANGSRPLAGIVLSGALLFVAVSGIQAACGRNLAPETALLLAIAFELSWHAVSDPNWNWGG